jgi:RimJ/RimL family protein N-acetyltransferase
MIDGMTPFEKAQLSAAWLAQFEASTAADHWVHGFRLLHRSSGNIVGFCSFKGPPADGVVEIAYGIAPEEQGKGYATEAARALVEFARTFPEVRVIRAHTLPDGAASKRVLEKCGFQHTGEVMDPEDGLVWRFESACPV